MERAELFFRKLRTLFLTVEKSENESRRSAVQQGPLIKASSVKFDDWSDCSAC